MSVQQTMGLDGLESPNLVFKRKYRWTMSVSWNGQTVPEQFVKSASRPNFSVEEQEINYMHGKMWIPGKPTYETMSVTYYDVGGQTQSGGSISTLYSWLASVYNFTGTPASGSSATYTQASKMGDGYGNVGYAGTGNLKLYDGCGNRMEEWSIFGMWPTQINFGDLAYDSNEEVTIEVTFRYYRATFQLYCNGGTINPICVGCQ